MIPSELKIDKILDGALLTLTGEWKLGNMLPPADGVRTELGAGENERAGSEMVLLFYVYFLR